MARQEPTSAHSRLLCHPRPTPRAAGDGVDDDGVDAILPVVAVAVHDVDATAIARRQMAIRTANWCPADVSALTSNSRPFARYGAATRAMTRRTRVNIYVRRVRIASGRRRRVCARMRPSHDVRLSVGLSTFRAPFVDASTSPSRTSSRADMSAQGGSSQERIASQAVGIGRSTSRPQSKSQFAGYAANADLRVDGSSSASSSGASSAAAAMQAQRRRRPSHPWLDYPPDFERKAGAVLGAAARVLNPANLLAPLPPALKYSLTRNFGFVTKTFTQFFDPEGVKSVQESIGLGK